MIWLTFKQSFGGKKTVVNINSNLTQLKIAFIYLLFMGACRQTRMLKGLAQLKSLGTPILGTHPQLVNGPVKKKKKKITLE